jgi:hypothetical protein
MVIEYQVLERKIQWFSRIIMWAAGREARVLSRYSLDEHTADIFFPVNASREDANEAAELLGGRVCCSVEDQDERLVHWFCVHGSVHMIFDAIPAWARECPEGCESAQKGASMTGSKKTEKDEAREEKIRWILSIMRWGAMRGGNVTAYYSPDFSEADIFLPKPGMEVATKAAKLLGGRMPCCSSVDRDRGRVHWYCVNGVLRMEFAEIPAWTECCPDKCRHPIKEGS